MHEEAFVDAQQLMAELNAKSGHDLEFIVVPTSMVSLEAAVKSYLFNSQLIKVPGASGMSLILPEESRENAEVYAYLQRLETQDTSIQDIRFVDVRQSMQNGGGPACLRLRVALTDDELAAVNDRFILDDKLLTKLNRWVEKHYRDQIKPEDLSDPNLAVETFAALDDLTSIFGLGSFYEFQR